LNIASSLFLAQETPNTGFAGFVDKAARTPQGTIVFWVAVLTVVRLLIFLWSRKVPFHKRIGTAHGLGRMVNELLDAIIYAGVFVFLLVRPYLIQAFRIPSGSMVSTLLVNDFIVANKFVYRYSNPQEGDVVVFVPPKDGVLDKSGFDANGNVDEDYIKRCIGVPGDVVELHNDIVYRNGKPIDEPYKHYTQATNADQSKFVEIGERQAEVQDGHPMDFKFVNYNGQIWPVNIEGSLVNSDSRFVAPKYYVDNNAQLMDKLRSLPPAAIPPGYYFFMGDNRNDSFDGRAWGLVPRASIVGRADYIWYPLSRISRIRQFPGSK